MKIKSNHKNFVRLVGLYTYCKMMHGAHNVKRETKSLNLFLAGVFRVPVVFPSPSRQMQGQSLETGPDFLLLKPQQLQRTWKQMDVLSYHLFGVASHSVGTMVVFLGGIAGA